ncbi:MAG: phosphate acyltransferase PlsX [Proteobacteria bacterium]|nr:phosphate acyltransferase PlsX [Pseudomonadota bacterium]
MIIAVDAMGGDRAPHVTVEGAYLAVEELEVTIALVGDKNIIEPLLEEHKFRKKRGSIVVVHAPEVISMSESPSVALRKKKNSSISVALEMVKRGEADAALSAGNSGAMMAFSMFVMKRLAGVERPAIATVMPNINGATVLLDAGANVDCKPIHLVQFGIMGSAYASTILGIKFPRVGLLSNGEEEEKGTDLTREAHDIFKRTPLNYVGYIEGRDIFKGTVDVVVCDGFVGNIVLKVAEGVAYAITNILKSEVNQSIFSKLGFAIAMPALRALKKKIDYEEYGGAPLLGVDGISIICHGSSSSYAIKNAIRYAKECVEKRLNTILKVEMEKYSKGLAEEGQRGNEQ